HQPSPTQSSGTRRRGECVWPVAARSPNMLLKTSTVSAVAAGRHGVLLLPLGRARYVVLVALQRYNLCIATSQPRWCQCRGIGRGMSRIAGIVLKLVRRLNRATLGGLVVDEDRRPRVKLLPDLEDLRGEWDVLCTVVG